LFKPVLVFLGSERSLDRMTGIPRIGTDGGFLFAMPRLTVDAVV
jgi:hypothetical protein